MSPARLIPYAAHTCGSGPAWGALVNHHGHQAVAQACAAVFARTGKPVPTDACRQELSAPGPANQEATHASPPAADPVRRPARPPRGRAAQLPSGNPAQPATPETAPRAYVCPRCGNHETHSTSLHLILRCARCRSLLEYAP